MSSVVSTVTHKHPEIRQLKGFVQSLDVELPQIEKFWTLGEATALRVRQDGTFLELIMSVVFCCMHLLLSIVQILCWNMALEEDMDPCVWLGPCVILV